MVSRQFLDAEGEGFRGFRRRDGLRREFVEGVDVERFEEGEEDVGSKRGTEILVVKDGVKGVRTGEGDGVDGEAEGEAVAVVLEKSSLAVGETALREAENGNV